MQQVANGIGAASKGSMKRFNGTIEYLSGQKAAIITLTCQGEWAGAGRIDLPEVVMKTVTATTITDAQIRESGAAASDIEHALTRTDRHWTRFQRVMRLAARSRCAVAWNARHAKAGENASRRLAGAESDHCTTCKGPIDENGECRCSGSRVGKEPR